MRIRNWRSVSWVSWSPELEGVVSKKNLANAIPCSCSCSCVRASGAAPEEMLREKLGGRLVDLSGAYLAGSLHSLMARALMRFVDDMVVHEGTLEPARALLERAQGAPKTFPRIPGRISGLIIALPWLLGAPLPCATSRPAPSRQPRAIPNGPPHDQHRRRARAGDQGDVSFCSPCGHALFPLLLAAPGRGARRKRIEQ